LVAILIIAVVEWLSWRNFRYGIGAGEVVIEKGVLSRSRRAIPFERVQDVDIERGPLARLFGLAKVKIETGGSGKDEGLLDSITVEEADRLRAAIRAGRAEAPVPAEGEAPAGAAAPIFAMSPRRVLLLGLFNFSMLYLAVLFGILNTVEPWIPFDIYDPGRWLGLVGEEQVRNLTLGAAAAVALVALLLGAVTGLVTTVLRDFGFRLLDEGRRFRRERGLLTRTEIVLPKRRVQLATVQTGPVRRVMGFADLRLQTLGGAGESGGQQSVAPLARPDEIERLVEASDGLALPPPGALRRVARGHVWRSAIRASVLPTAAILASSWWVPEVLVGLLFLPVVAAGAMLDRRFGGYALQDGLLHVRKGVLRQQLWIVPVAKAQSLTLTRSPLQRMLGLATLAIDTAGAPALGGVRVVDLDIRTARSLRARMAARLRALS
jgi:putative membrane protein